MTSGSLWTVPSLTSTFLPHLSHSCSWVRVLKTGPGHHSELPTNIITAQTPSFSVFFSWSSLLAPLAHRILLFSKWYCCLRITKFCLKHSWFLGGSIYWIRIPGVGGVGWEVAYDVYWIWVSCREKEEMKEDIHISSQNYWIEDICKASKTS